MNIGMTMYAAAMKQTNSMLGIIKKGIKIKLSISTVQQLLKYCVQFWTLCLNDVAELQTARK